ncbi:FAS1-like dehydratase domain-containing protein [Natrinema longum]|uniref:MaoC family dehydratase N-terminal domain-containing protein n=1 Tax=Natrinema longum TaxID=370324 RepID=A0A8A2UDL5_9EURY|nr:MaoC family dehydratase N-terminal domain-containing protein [Natrinema longum]MBZ6495235.1 MaoC family dehydratase N-terminal domain-containing protein [Natrinema longum]QSW86786.1 MaoC family dehydratase N-terminal domain-containing protein [Natrinema longum]
MPNKPLEELEAMVGDSRVTAKAFRIEPGKVEEFARAITSDDPVFRDETAAAERGHDRVPAPLTYTQVARFPRYTPADVDGKGFDLGFQPEYVLHGEQAHEYERPIYVGDVLEGTTTLADVFQREGGRAGTMTFAVLETEYRTRDGDLVLTDRSTAIETQGAVDDGDGNGDGEAGEPTDDPAAETNGGAARTEPTAPSETTAEFERVHTVDDLAVGDAGPTVVVEDLERQHFVKYAGASGDFNPIHYDEPYATAAGNESVFGQGMFTAGLTSRVVTEWFDLADVASFGLRFQSRVFPGDTVVATGEVVEVDRDSGTVETALEARTTDGETLLTGTATADLE